MKKLFLSVLLAVLTLAAGAATAASGVPHRLVYGYFMSYDDSGIYGIGRFYMDDPTSTEFLDQGDGNMGWFCGACVRGVLYGCQYEYNLTEGPVPTGFMAYDLTTGKKTKVGDYADPDTPNPNLKYIDMTYDYSTETMLAVGFELGTTSLFKFDLTTGKAEKIVDLDAGLGTIACNMKGELYGIGQDGVVKKVDRQTGHCTDVFNTGYSGMLSNQSIEFDHTTGDLYWASNVINPDERADRTILVKIDLDSPTPTMQDMTELPYGSRLLALYIPFVKAGENAPKAVDNLKVTPGAEGAPQATLQWTNPSLTFGGNQLSDLKSVTIKRGDKIVGTVETTEPGKAMEFVDKDVPDGEYRYTVYATNATGDGEEAYMSAYVGRDCPSAPANATVKPGEGCATGIISWEKPTEGLHGGYFTDEGLTYRIVRYPDEVEVAKGLTATSFTDDKLRRLGKYYYKVYASNPYGEAASTTNANVLGKAIEVSESQEFVEGFTDQDYFYNRWTEIDGNHDNYSWTFNSLAPSYQFGDNAPGAEYFINPGVTSSGQAADEWLITPPLDLKAGRKYAATISVRVISDENVSLTFGSTNEATGQTVVKDLVIKPTQKEGETPVPFTDYTVDLPMSQVDRIGCVGIHITTPYPESGFSFFHMTSVKVKDVTSTGISDIKASKGDEQLRIYNANGQYVGKSLKGLKKGFYIRGGKKLLVK